MKIEKSPLESEVVTRHLIMPSNSNPRGTVFGGTIMSWMDMAAAMVATKHAEKPVVTVHISDIDFISPINLGMHAVVKASINYVGNTSMVVGCRVESEDPYTSISHVTTKAYLTFVALDDQGRPSSVPGLKLINETYQRRFDEAKARKEARRNYE